MLRWPMPLPESWRWRSESQFLYKSAKSQLRPATSQLPCSYWRNSLHASLGSTYGRAQFLAICSYFCGDGIVPKCKPCCRQMALDRFGEIIPGRSCCVLASRAPKVKQAIATTHFIVRTALLLWPSQRDRFLRHETACMARSHMHAAVS